MEAQAHPPVVVLDIDGVLNTERNCKKQRGASRPFDPEAVCALNKILAETGAKIVVSSTWRYNRSIVELDQLLVHEGMPGGLVIGATPKFLDEEDTITSWRNGEKITLFRGVPRHKEIRAWLDQHPEVDAWVVIDDDTDAEPEILCDSFQGLTMEAADLAIEHLRRMMEKNR